MFSWFRRKKGVGATQTPSRSFVPAIESLEERLTPSSPRDILIAQESLLNSQLNNGAGYSNYKDSGSLAWGESYVLSTYLTMYHATQDTRYLDQFVTQANRVISNATDANGDGYLGWGTTAYSLYGSYAEYAVHDGMITAPMAQFAAYVKQNPSLRTTYHAPAAKYLAFIHTNILPKWEPYYQMIDDTSGTYTFPDDDSSVIPLSSLPYNQNLALGRVFLWLYAAEGSRADAQRATELGNTFKNSLTIDDGGRAYSWNYADYLLPTDYDVNNVAEDTSHANTDVGFALLANQMGLVFSNTDIQRFIYTFTDVMWNRSYAKPEIRNQVNGAGAYTYSRYLFDWAALASFHSSVNNVWSVVTAVYDYNHYWNNASRQTAMLTISRLIDAMPANGQLLSNGSFESVSGSNAAMPAGWYGTALTPGRAARENSNSVDGSWALVVTNTPLATQTVQQSLFYLPGGPITVSFWGCTNSSLADGRLQVYDASTGKVLTQIDFTNTTWQQFNFSFSAPAQAGHNLLVRVFQTSKVAHAAAYFDNVVVSQ